MLAEDFKEILDIYKDEKAKNFKDNSLVFKIRNVIPKNLSKLLDDNFTVKAACGVSSWPESPWITIIHNSFDSTQESLIIQYNFDIQNKCLSLSIVPRLINPDEYISTKEYLTDFLSSYDLNDFQIDNILSKTYRYEEITDSNLNNDLNCLIPVYIGLCEIFNESKNPNKNINVKQINQKAIDEFLSDGNIKKIIACSIEINDYKEIIKNIKSNAKESLESLIHRDNYSKLTIKEKVFLISQSFTQTEYKSVGRLLGSYSFNKITIDDRLASPLIITSIIHELSHFLLETILKEVLMKILNEENAALTSGFVKITLEDNDLNYLLDEYCAHTTEGRFALYGFQDYSSFNYKLNEISDLYSKEDITYALLIGNTFAYEIKSILEEFIGENLREEIKNEFLTIRDSPDYEPLDLEIESKLDDNDFIDAIAVVLASGLSEVLNQKEKLERYMLKYEKSL